MAESIIVAVITGGLSLIGVLVSTSRTSRNLTATIEKNQAITDTKVDELTREVREHNGFAKRIPVLEKQVEMLEKDVQDLERKE